MLRTTTQATSITFDLKKPPLMKASFSTSSCSSQLPASRQSIPFYFGSPVSVSLSGLTSSPFASSPESSAASRLEAPVLCRSRAPSLCPVSLAFAHDLASSGPHPPRGGCTDCRLPLYLHFPVAEPQRYLLGAWGQGGDLWKSQHFRSHGGWERRRENAGRHQGRQ